MSPRLSHLASTIYSNYRDPVRFTLQAGRLRLRPYQAPVVAAIVDSIRHRRGLSFVVIFPRQSGKNETQAALYVYLLKAFRRVGGDVIHVEPTFKPQTIIAMQRLEKRLKTNLLTKGTKKWRKLAGYMYGLGDARVIHYSADLTANVVGATAGLLLSVNEAQDVNIQKFDKDFVPMAASTNATRVFWGTRWTDDTLLEREYQAALIAQESDGRQRVFFITADDVSAVLPPYRDFVAHEVQRLGREHPLIKTQYYCETITATSGMFPPARLLLMHGAHPRLDSPPKFALQHLGGAGGGSPFSPPIPGGAGGGPGPGLAFLLDVGGQDEKTLNPAELDNPARDFTTLTIVALDPCSLPAYEKPTYRTLYRRSWIGEKHTTVHAQVNALWETFNPQYGVIDATGVGEGLWSMLDLSHPGQWTPVKFTAQEKSAIGYGLISIIETGRLREYAPFDDELLLQLQKCKSEVRPGPAKLLTWGVPNGLRDANGQFIHDDLLLSLSLVAILDRLQWHIQTQPASLPGFNPLDQVKGF